MQDENKHSRSSLAQYAASRLCLLVIMDGWGVSFPSRGNAIALASTPVFNYLLRHYRTFTLNAAGESVGLPWGEMGNSEVGHLALGSGKVVYQDVMRITKAIENGNFFKNEVFLKAFQKVKRNKSTLHLIGLVSDGAVHGYNEHLYSLIEFANVEKIERVVIHAILDGRDVPYNSGVKFVHELEQKIARLHSPARVATIVGRQYAMDRDSRWERISAVYDAMTQRVPAELPSRGKAFFETAGGAIAAWYQSKIYDEELPPTIIQTKGADDRIQNGDAVVFTNYRADRARELTRAFVDPSCPGVRRSFFCEDLFFVTMTEYEENLPVSVAFPKERIDYPLARVFSDHGYKQIHIAETEKYAHVTFFFNGGREDPYPGEDRVLVPSPRDVASYDQKPEMSAMEVTKRCVDAVRSGVYAFIVVNFANPDMVGHTGKLLPTVRAIEVIDGCLRILTDAVLHVRGNMVVTADHGNAEEVVDLISGEIDKEHSATPVPCIIVGEKFMHISEIGSEQLHKVTPSGLLSDVAPTILKIVDLPQPTSMEGRSLV